MSKPKLFLAAALALSGMLGAGAAHAGNRDVQWTVTIGSPVGVPVVHQPVIVQQPVVVHRPVVAAPVYPAHGPRYGYSQPRRWDHDGDGIPNRRDAVYNPRWDRDGDGIPNRRDAVYNPRWDRDGDGIPNRHDGYDNRRHPHWQHHRGGQDWR